MPAENYCYTKVVLNDNMPVDDSLSGREIQLIVGSPSKMAESTLVEFASQFTRDMRTKQGWSTVHVIVEPIEFQDSATGWKPNAYRGRHERLDCGIDAGVWINNRIAAAASRDAIGPHLGQSGSNPLWFALHSGAAGQAGNDRHEFCGLDGLNHVRLISGFYYHWNP